MGRPVVVRVGGMGIEGLLSPKRAAKLGRNLDLDVLRVAVIDHNVYDVAVRQGAGHLRVNRYRPREHTWDERAAWSGCSLLGPHVEPPWADHDRAINALDRAEAALQLAAGHLATFNTPAIVDSIRVLAKKVRAERDRWRADHPRCLDVNQTKGKP
jgi:hypothetical protein